MNTLRKLKKYTNQIKILSMQILLSILEAGTLHGETRNLFKAHTADKYAKNII